MIRRTIAVVITLLFIIVIPGLALAEDVSLTLSAESAKSGDSVTASGTADPGTWVPVKVLDSAQSIIVWDAVRADADGKYSNTFKIPAVSDGVLKVITGSGDNVADKNLTIGTSTVAAPTTPQVVTPSGGGGGTTTPQVITPVNQPAEVVKEKAAETTPVQSPAATLNDVANNWAAPSINKLVAAGAVKGFPDGSFKPDNTISRAEFITVLVKAFNLEVKGGKVFGDTNNHWAKDYISTAVANGIVTGYSDATFGTGDFITREQMAVMIVKAAKLTAVIGGKDFADNTQISSWAREAITVATTNGIFSGYQDNTFKPQGYATRAEAVTVVVKAIK